MNHMENKKQLRKSPATPASSVLTFDNTPKRGWASKNSASPLITIEEGEQEKLKTQSPTVPKNPFDVKAESLYFHSCSPSVFATFSRNKTNDGKVGWSVEHLSLLYPADIDETSTQDPWEDTDQEIKAQQAIDAFFSQNSVVPSPWSETPEGTDENKLRRNVRRFCSFQNVLSCDAETQTKLTIPPEVDLMALLGDRFIYDEYSCSRESSCCEADVLSNSSLRRKLFVADEDFSSPLGDERKNLILTRRSTSSIHMRSVHSTPASDVLSSSPITPPKHSESINVLSISPPALSPIANVNYDSGGPTSPIEQFGKGNSFQSCGDNSVVSMCTVSENAMSFCVDSQDTFPNPSNGSERQDTGYVTGSITSSQSGMVSDENYVQFSRITPIMELVDECDISNSGSIDNMSYVNSCAPSTFDFLKGTDPNSCNFKSLSRMPNCCSTPTVSAEL